MSSNNYLLSRKGHVSALVTVLLHPTHGHPPGSSWWQSEREMQTQLLNRMDTHHLPPPAAPEVSTPRLPNPKMPNEIIPPGAVDALSVGRVL